MKYIRHALALILALALGLVLGYPYSSYNPDPPSSFNQQTTASPYPSPTATLYTNPTEELDVMFLSVIMTTCNDLLRGCDEIRENADRYTDGSSSALARVLADILTDTKPDWPESRNASKVRERLFETATAFPGPAANAVALIADATAEEARDIFENMLTPPAARGGSGEGTPTPSDTASPEVSLSNEEEDFTITTTFPDPEETTWKEEDPMTH
jgi:hypothetical protein